VPKRGVDVAPTTLAVQHNPNPDQREFRDWRRRACEAVALVGTPCYVAAWRPVAEALSRIEEVAGKVPLRSWLSFKTHPLPALAEEWLRAGRGIEVVSESELLTVMQLGCTVDRLLVNGVAKHTWLPRYPIRGLRVHFDSLREIEALLAIAVACSWRVGIRCHVPDECDRREPHFGGQFGMSHAEAVEGLRRLREAGADVQSVHFHIGQRRESPHTYTRALACIADVCQAASFTPRIVDLGGGLPADDDPGWKEAVQDLAAAVRQASMFFPGLAEIWLENGRAVTHHSALLAVRILDIKERHECRYAICDGGLTNHALAADDHPHAVQALVERVGTRRLTTVCGPTCMTDDRLGRLVLPNDTAVGDVLLWLDAGAYHLPWETRFSHGLCAIAWFGPDEQAQFARDREPPARWARPLVRAAS
jgi:diaminopimelate decarboxylase